MKKLFTLIAALVCAVCVNAQNEVDIPINDWTWNYNAENLIKNDKRNINEVISNREDLFKKRFWTLVGKMIISFTIIAVFFILLKRIIELSDFQWLYDIDSVSYYRDIETFNRLYYNGTVYLIISAVAPLVVSRQKLCDQNISFHRDLRI